MFGRCILTKTQINRFYVNGDDMRQVMSHLKNEGTYFVGGSNSLWVPKTKTKYLDRRSCRPWMNLEGEIGLMSPGEAVRAELTREWPDLKRVGWSPGHVTLLDYRSPLHYTGQAVGRMTYVDLDGAYCQIYEKLWLDTSFPRGYRGRYPLSDVAGRLKVWKGARNALVGIARSRDATAYKGTKRITLKVKNKYLSPGLWATVQAILHMIARMAIIKGAIYVNVDGYVFPETAEANMDEFLFYLSDLGFRWSIRSQGKGEIVSWNNYQIGAARTKAHELGLTRNSREFSNVNINDEQNWEQYWRGCCRIQRHTAGNDYT